MISREYLSRIVKIGQNKNAKKQLCFGILSLTFGKKVGKIAKNGKIRNKKKLYFFDFLIDIEKENW